MKQDQLAFADGARLTMQESIDLTIQSLQAYGNDHEHWAIAWSGGKDSSGTLTLILHLISTGMIPRPKSLIVLYADTRMEILPLAIAALAIIQRMRDLGIDVRIVCAPIDKRYFVNLFGRGVPPPNNGMRWCTRQIKVDPMQDALAELITEIDGQMLVITGVRQGESAMRDRRIEMSCGKDGAECGQGWYQQVVPNSPGLRGRIATLAPLLHWRVCHVWDWLSYYAPTAEYGGWPTQIIADAYGGDEAQELNARTGCVGCPLTQEDRALEITVRNPVWSYLAPLRQLQPLYVELREPRHRLRKPGERMGPLTFAAREMALARVLEIQAQCNASADAADRPRVDILNAEEEARIRELIAAETWPQGWDGDEPRADEPHDQVYRDGAVQPLLFRS